MTTPFDVLVEELFSLTLNCKLVPADIRQAFNTVREATINEIIHEWNKGELRLDGTAQGAVNCIEHFRNYLATLSTKDSPTT